MDENKPVVPQVDSEQIIVRKDDSLEGLRKELRITRIFCGIASVLLVCVLLGGALMFGKIQDYAKQTQPLVDKLAEVDYRVLNETMSSLNTSLNEIDWAVLSEQLSEIDWKRLSEDIGAIDWEALSEELSELDMDALNEAIAGLDTKELSTTLKNLNETAEAMKNFSDAWKGFLAKWGIGSTDTDT